jgi:hypothetical protein
VCTADTDCGSDEQCMPTSVTFNICF